MKRVLWGARRDLLDSCKRSAHGVDFSSKSKYYHKIDELYEFSDE